MCTAVVRVISYVVLCVEGISDLPVADCSGLTCDLPQSMGGQIGQEQLPGREGGRGGREGGRGEKGR